MSALLTSLRAQLRTKKVELANLKTRLSQLKIILDQLESSFEGDVLDVNRALNITIQHLSLGISENRNSINNCEKISKDLETSAIRDVNLSSSINNIQSEIFSVRNKIQYVEIEINNLYRRIAEEEEAERQRAIEAAKKLIGVK